MVSRAHLDVPPLPAGTVLQARLKEVEQRLQEAREAQDSPGNCGQEGECASQPGYQFFRPLS